MMNKCLWIFFFLLPLFPARSEDKLFSLSQQAEALWEARDYASASQIYEQLLSPSLPDWQQARIFYNLGTIQLTQHKPLEALKFFQKINPFTLSLPNFGRHLYLNEGIAYLQYAENLAAADSSLDQQALFVEQSLRAFDQARILDCQGQKEEQKSEPSPACETSSQLDQWMKTARLKLDAIYQKKKQNWIEQADASSLAAFLNQQLQQTMKHLTSLEIQKQNSAEQTTFKTYFQDQAESLSILWNALQQKEFSLDQKEAFEKSADFYRSAVEALNQQKFDIALNKWKQSIEALNLLTFQDHADVRQAVVDYQLLLLQERISISSLENLVAEFNSLKEESSFSDSLKLIQNNLRLSLKALEKRDSVQARFFLLAGFSPIQILFQENQNSPAAILQQGIDQANRALEMTFLSEMMTKEASQKTSVYKTLKAQQQEILTRVASFIPSVLKEQERLFNQSLNANTNCQDTPWDQVIPLYDRGYRAVQSSIKEVDKTPFDSQIIIAHLEQAIKDWQQALKLILHPPQPKPAASTSQKLTENVRLLQDMYLQDQSQPAEKTKEMQSW